MQSNYRPVSILSNISKIVKKLFSQIPDYFEKILIKISIWFSNRIQNTAIFINHDRKMAPEFRYRRTLWGTLNRFINSF